MYEIDIVNKIEAKNKVEAGQVYQDGQGLSYVIIIRNGNNHQGQSVSYGLLNMDNLKAKEWRYCPVEMECLIQATNLAYIGMVKKLSVEVK